MDRAERRRSAKVDERLLTHGIDPKAQDVEPTAAMARQLWELIERAKLDANVDRAVQFLYSKVDATIHGLRKIPVACKKGCAHCCHLWVSATALEVLFVAKQLRRNADQAAIDRISAAHAYTKDFDFEARAAHPFPCPLLRDDACTIYQFRPRACRFAASADAAACERLIRHGAVDEVPIPVLYIRGRNAYSMAPAIALKRAELPYRSYEFSAALVRAFARAERAWLSGENVFDGVIQDPGDAFADRAGQFIYDRAFK